MLRTVAMSAPLALPLALAGCIDLGEPMGSEPTARPVPTPRTEPAARSDAAPSTAARPHMDHTPRHGGLVLMQGDYHIEVVPRPDGEYRLYLSDAFRRPLPGTRMNGRVLVRLPGARDVATPLLPGPDDEYFVARGPRPVHGEVVVTVDVHVGDMPWSIEVPFQIDEQGRYAPGGHHRQGHERH